MPVAGSHRRRGCGLPGRDADQKCNRRW